jgi:hypothetical protein
MRALVKIGTLCFMLILIPSCDNNMGEEASIEAEVAMINKNCPKMLDEETRLEKVVFTKPALIVYNYSLVNVSRQNVDTAQFRMALWPGILSTIRIDTDLAGLRERQMNFEYRYYDKTKELIYTFKIAPLNYQP